MKKYLEMTQNVVDLFFFVTKLSLFYYFNQNILRMNKDAFNESMMNMNELKTLYENFDLIWMDYLDLFASCELDYIEHYITNMFECVFYVLKRAQTTENDLNLQQNFKSCERIDVEASKLAIKNIIFDMDNKYQQLSDWLFKRNKDISRSRSVYDKPSKIIKVVASQTHKYRVLMDTSSSVSTFSFESQRSMSNEINNLVIPIPPTAPGGYEHDSLLTTKSSGENIVNDSFTSPVSTMSGSVSSFNTANKIGSRSFGKSKKRKAYKSNVEEEFESPVKKGVEADFGISSSLSTTSTCANNTSTESIFTSLESSFDCSVSPSNTLLASFSDALKELGQATSPIMQDNFHCEVYTSETSKNSINGGVIVSNKSMAESSVPPPSPLLSFNVVLPFDFDNEANNKQSCYRSELDRADVHEDEPPAPSSKINKPAICAEKNKRKRSSTLVFTSLYLQLFLNSIL